MNVLHVIASMNPATGGVCQAVRTIVSSLESLKVQNEVVCLDAPQDDFIGRDPFVLHALGPAKGPWAHSRKLKPWLLKNMGRFDAVIVHGLWLYPSYVSGKCLTYLKRHHKKLGTKLFIMPHGMLDPYFQKASGRKLKALRNKVYWQRIESKVVNGADGLLFTCEEEKILARQPFKPYCPKQETVVGLGVEKPQVYTPLMRVAFLQKCPGIRDNDYFLFLGRIHEKKGVDLLVNAYMQIARNNRFPNLPKLVIAGPGLDAPFGQQLQKLIDSVEGMNERVLFPGMLEGDAKWGAFYNARAFILPSHQENFGIAVVEALACSKPVLISNQVNIWREIQKSGAGIIEDDSETGTLKLFTTCCELTHQELELMEQNAQRCYGKYFAIGPSADNLYSAIGK